MYTKKSISVSVVALVLLVCLIGAAWGSVNVAQYASTGLQEGQPVIVLDAGHGGMDGGAVGNNGALEKDVNLSITLKLRDFLSAFGWQVVMVRDTDTSIHDASAGTIREQKVSDIRNRTAIMNEYQDSTFLSIHQNFFPQTQYHGSQVFYSKNDARSEPLAVSIQQSVCELLQPDNTRVAKAMGKESYLLNHAKVPAVMIECGFLSNPEECARLSDEEYQKKLCMAVMKGIFANQKPDAQQAPSELSSQ
ncbi:MAG: cell wall hydrolase [Clostridiales bacterium]|nr:cell wall hydrolase [Clostridiales bacterium]